QLTVRPTPDSPPVPRCRRAVSVTRWTTPAPSTAVPDRFTLDGVGQSRHEEQAMGRPVVHFEVMGTDAAALQRFYGELFDWKIDANNPMQYGIVEREPNLNAESVGIGGGIGPGPEGYQGHATFYVEVPDV